MQERGDSAKHVAEKLRDLFKPTARSAADEYLGQPAPYEDPDVLEQLSRWVYALYDIRNSHSHGKKVRDYSFNERSVWGDSVEIFKLASNRVILRHAEPRPMLGGTQLCKLLMSELYLERFISVFHSEKKLFLTTQEAPPRRDMVGNSRSQFHRWLILIVHSVGKFLAGRKRKRNTLNDLLSRTRTIDPEQVEWVRSLSQFRQALYVLSSLIYRSAKDVVATRVENAEACKNLLSGLDEAYKATASESREAKISFRVDKYLRRAAPYIESTHRLIPILGGKVYLSELTRLFAMLHELYRDFRNGDTAP